MIVQPIAVPKTQTAFWRTVPYETRNGAIVVVAAHRSALSDACRADADYVISFSTPLYACRNGAFVVDISKFNGRNHLILFTKQGGITVKSTAIPPRWQ